MSKLASVIFNNNENVIEQVQTLIDEGEPVNRLPDNMGHSPLSAAVYMGKEDIVKMLVLAGARTDDKSIIGTSLLDSAISMNNTSMVRLLCKLSEPTENTKINELIREIIEESTSCANKIIKTIKSGNRFDAT